MGKRLLGKWNEKKSGEKMIAIWMVVRREREAKWWKKESVVEGEREREETAWSKLAQKLQQCKSQSRMIEQKSFVGS